MNDTYLIAHDVGTGGSKAALTDLEGNIIASRFAPYPTSYPREHWAEQDTGDWWKAITVTTREVLDETGIDRSKVTGIIYSTQMLGVLPVDGEGKQLRPAIIWLDGRAQDQADRIIRRATRTGLLLLAGGLPTGKDIIPKLMWLREHEPGVVQKTCKFLEVDSYLVHRSCGEFVYDFSAASATGMFNFKKKCWDELLARVFKVKLDKLPRVAPSYERAGGLTKEAAEEMGLPEGVTVFVGTGDVASAAAGSGAVLDGQGHVYIGSSGWIAVTLPKALNDGRKGIVSISSADPQKHLLLAETECAGACFKWLAENVTPAGETYDPGADIYDYLNELAAKSEPGSRGLVFTPWLYGERSPIPDTTVRGGFVNLSIDHDRCDITRAVMEGVALHARWMLEGVKGCGFNDPVLRAIGGGAKSDLWMQIYADACGSTIEVVNEPQESGARGAALIAAVGLGHYRDFASIRNAVKVIGTFKPRSEFACVYNEAFDVLKDTYAGLKKMYRRINAGEA